MNATTGAVVHLTPTLVGAFASHARLLWLVNVGWKACGFSMALDSDWHKLAKRFRHEVAVTYWDADLYPDVPEPIGATNITPAIRAIIPATTEGERPQTVHYRGTRHLHDLFKFASDLMPNFVVRVDGEEAWAQLSKDATERGLPRVIFVLDLPPDSPTPPVLKALSAIYRNKLLVAEVRVHETTPESASVASRFGVASLPGVVALPPDGGESDPWRHTGHVSHRGLNSFAKRVLRNTAAAAAAAAAAAGPAAPTTPAAGGQQQQQEEEVRIKEEL